MSTKNQHTLDSLWIKYQNTLEVLNDTLDELEETKKQLASVQKQVTEPTEVVTDAKDYWGRPKAIGNSKSKDELSYEEQTKLRFDRIVKEVRSGALDINTLNHGEQVIVRKLMNE
tara:strand:- start:509 stop:853 length:345 start_codon:yes stop_codon:yes gene_type:complete